MSKGLIREWAGFNWVVWSCLGYLLVLNVPHTVAAQYVFSGLVLLGFFWQAVRRQLTTSGWTPLLLAFFLLCLVCVMSTLASPYREISLPGLRKEIAPYLLTFVLLVSQKLAPEAKRRLAAWVVGATLLAYALRVGLAFSEGAGNGFEFSIYDLGVLPKFLDYFAIDSTLFIPIVLAFLLFSKQSTWIKLGLSVVLGFQIYIIIVSGIRTAFLITLIVLNIALIVRFWRSPAFWVVFILLWVVGTYEVKQHPDNINVQRYISLTDGSAYKSAATSGPTPINAMGGRYTIWTGMLELEAKRPWLGFGLGWKKIPSVAADLGLVDEWKSKASDPWYGAIYSYFSLGEGAVNPHNLPILIGFEIGAVGLGVFLLFLAIMFFNAVNLARVGRGVAWIGYATLFYLVNYGLLGVSNATWFTGTWLCLAIALVLCSRDRPSVGLTR